MRKWKKRHKIMLVIGMVTMASYLLALRLPQAVDWYRGYLLPIGVNTLARLMSLLPCSVGELCIYLALALLAGAVIVGLFCFWKKGRFRKFARLYWEGMLWICIWVMATETFHCYILYHASTLEETYLAGVDPKEEVLEEVWQMLAGRANQLSEQMERDASGTVVYDGDLYKQCQEAMRSLGDAFPYLKGYYPNPKPIAASDFMSQQRLAGIYFPYTLEANYNTTMYIMNRPATICHEFSHLKGVILEDEANFFGFLACFRSDDPFLEYSACLSVLPYLANEVRRTLDENARNMLIKLNDWVKQDAVFLTEASWKKVEEKAVVETETVNKMTDAFLENNLKANGVADGMASYSRVVRLVLKWYVKEIGDT